MECMALYEHLHNNNPPDQCGMAFVDPNTGQPIFVKTKKKTAAALINWSVDSLWRSSEKKVAFIPFSANTEGMSCWGGLDFDAHDGNFERAITLARRALKLVTKDPALFVILEDSGQGYHLWLISLYFQSVNWWVRKLKKLAHDIEAPIVTGLCEIFPDNEVRDRCGKGMRAPGSINPKNGSFSKILFENCSPMLQKLLARKAAASPAEGKDFFSLSRENQPSLEIARKFLSTNKINQIGTRNEKLIKLTSSLFPIAGHKVARNAASTQFREKTVDTNANLADHMKSFEKHWTNMLKTWLSRLNDRETKAYKDLKHDTSKEAFKIIWHFNQISRTLNFSISNRSLALRLCITPQRAGQLRAEFVQLRIIKQIAEYQPNRRSAQFQWLLSESSERLNSPT
jgi:hypothetical protein